MRSGIPAASGARRAMALTASLSSATCPTCSWATGWSLRTWGPTLSRPPPPLMASKNRKYTTSCPAPPGEYPWQSYSGGTVNPLDVDICPRLQATCAADLPWNVAACGGVVPVRGSGLWPGEQLGYADEVLPSQCGLNVSYCTSTYFLHPPLKVLLYKTSRPVVQICFLFFFL